MKNWIIWAILLLVIIAMTIAVPVYVVKRGFQYLDSIDHIEQMLEQLTEQK